MKTFLLTLSFLSCSSLVRAQGSFVYQSNFSQGVNGGTIAPGVTFNWTVSNATPNCSNPIQTVPAPQDGRIFLGQFGEQQVSLLLDGLPPHDSISITFDFYTINTWDGNKYANYIAAPDIFGLQVGTDTLLYATFANNLNLNEFQTFPSNYPTDGSTPINNPPQTGAFSKSRLDFPNPDWWSTIGPQDEDAEYHLNYSLAHTGNSIQFDFLGDEIQDNPNLPDESWGIDSIIVRVFGCVRPTAVIAPNNPPPLCQGDTVTLHASPSGLQYHWLRNGKTLATTKDTLSVSDAGIYSVIVATPAGCSDSAAVSVNINPVPIAQISGPTSLCSGGSALLIASPAGLSYEWSKNGVPIASTSDSLLISDSGTYDVVVTNASGCSDSTSTQIGMIPSIVAAIDGATSICQGSNEILVANPAGMNYQWSRNGTVLSTSDSLTISDSGTYSVTVSNGSGCADSAQVPIAIAPIPIASIVGSKLICEGQAGILIASPSGLSYNWYKNGQKLPTHSDSLIVADSGNYSVLVSNGSGCSDSTSIAVAVTSLLAASISGPTVLCNGDMAILKVDPAGMNYNWLKNGHVQSVNLDSLVITDSGTYSVIVSNSAGCYDSVAQYVSITPPLKPAIAGRFSICEGDSSVLKAQPTNLIYEWEKDGVALSEKSDSITVLSSGNYSVIVYDPSGCSDSASAQVVVHVPTTPVVNVTDTLTTRGTILWASPGRSYLWNTGDTTQSIYVAQRGNYFVTVTDTNGCIASSPIVPFAPACYYNFLEDALNGSPIAFDKIISIGDELTIFVNKPDNASVNYEIDDVIGRSILKGSTSNSQISVPTVTIPEGILFVTISHDGFRAVKKVFLEK